MLNDPNDPNRPGELIVNFGGFQRKSFTFNSIQNVYNPLFMLEKINIEVVDMIFFLYFLQLWQPARTITSLIPTTKIMPLFIHVVQSCSLKQVRCFGKIFSMKI